MWWWETVGWPHTTWYSRAGVGCSGCEGKCLYTVGGVGGHSPSINSSRDSILYWLLSVGTSPVVTTYPCIAGPYLLQLMSICQRPTANSPHLLIVDQSIKRDRANSVFFFFGFAPLPLPALSTSSPYCPGINIMPFTRAASRVLLRQ
jgi:hypothetical protein